MPARQVPLGYIFVGEHGLYTASDVYIYLYRGIGPPRIHKVAFESIDLPWNSFNSLRYADDASRRLYPMALFVCVFVERSALLLDYNIIPMLYGGLYRSVGGILRSEFDFQRLSIQKQSMAM